MSFRPAIIEKSQVERQLKDLQAFRSDVWNHSGEYENIKALGNTFLASCDTDEDLVIRELQNIKEFWEKLGDNLRKLENEFGQCDLTLGSIEPIE